MYEKFVQLVKEKEVTIYRVAKETELPTSLFSEWKRGKSTPKVDKLQKIAAYFGVPVTYFLEEQQGGK